MLKLLKRTTFLGYERGSLGTGAKGGMRRGEVIESEAYDNRHYVRPAAAHDIAFDGGRAAKLHNVRLSDDRPLPPGRLGLSNVLLR